MASPLAWRWSWKPNTTTTDSALATSLPTSSIFYFSLTTRNRNRNRNRKLTHLTKFCLNQNRNPTRSSSSSDKSESALVGKSIEAVSASSSSFAAPGVSIGETTSAKNEIRLKRKRFGFGFVASKGSVWRRIFFASKKVRSIILLNVLALVYASDIPVVKEVEAIIDPAVFSVVRFTVTAIPFIPFMIRARGDKQIRDTGIELGIWVSSGYLMQALGLLTSDAGRASFISIFTVIIVPLLDGMLGAAIPVYTWFGALMSILGVAMLESSGSPPCIGDLWNFLSAVFFGVHILRTEHISRDTKKENFLALLGYEVCVIATFSTVWYLAGGWLSSDSAWDPGSLTWKLVLDWIVDFPWIPALYTGIFSSGLCLWVEMAAMCDVSATETSIIYGLEPLWGAGFAWFLLGERWGIIGWIGVALALGGSLTVQIFGSLPPSKSAKESSGQGDRFLVSDQRNTLSASPIVVSSRKDVDILKKK